MNPFTAHNQTVPLAGILPTTTELRRLSPALLSGDKNKVDAFADEMIQRELREASPPTSLKKCIHGEARHLVKRPLEYRIWHGIHARCNSQSPSKKKSYFDKGIKVCERWRTYQNFLSDMGRAPNPKSTLDRIDNNLGYSTENCRWASRKEQANNRKNNVFLEHEGQRLTVRQWSEKAGMDQKVLSDRIKKGLTMDQALTIPVKRGNHSNLVFRNAFLQRRLQSANAGVPAFVPTEEEIDRMHKLSAHLETFTEGRTWPTRTNRHDE